MHIPPYHKKVNWQYILIGAVFGAIIAYCIFIFMYGIMYERLLEDNLAHRAKITELNTHNKALLQDKHEIDEIRIEQMTVDKILINITNEQQLRLDRLIIHQLEEMIKQELNHIIGQDINIVSESDALLVSTIENKAFSIDDFTYYFEISRLSISQTVKLTMIAKLSN